MPFNSKLIKRAKCSYYIIERIFYSTKKQDGLQHVELDFTQYGKPGKAPPLLIFHAFFGSKSNYASFSKRLLKLLNPPRLIVTADLRNHGQSPHASDHTYPHMAMDIKALMEKLKFPKVSLLGHSMGGRAVMMFDFMFPALVEKSIIVDISHVREEESSGYLSVLQDMLSVELPKNTSLRKAVNTVDKELASKITNVWFRRFMLTNLRPKPDKTFYWRLNLNALIKDYDKYGQFPDIGDKTFEGPILFVLGEESDFVSRSHLTHIFKTFPNARVKYIEDAGHLVQIENPRAFAKVCAAFLNAV